MSRTYYICWYRLDGVDRFLIWYSGKTDGVFIDERRKILSFNSVLQLESFAINMGISVKMEDPILHDVDATIDWLKSKKFVEVNCENLLGSWNLFDDVSRSCSLRFDSNRNLTNRIYKKLFWGSNIPAVTPEGESFIPTWSKGQMKILRKTLRSGVSLFQKNIRQY